MPEMRVIVDLREQEFRKLPELSLDERRSLREQAAWLLGKVLRDIQSTPQSSGEVQNAR